MGEIQDDGMVRQVRIVDQDGMEVHQQGMFFLTLR